MSAAPLRWAEIDLGAVAHNVKLLKEGLREGAGLVAVVKANAYGHGAVPVSQAALAAGADWLAVATLAEGAELRAAGIDAPILLMGPLAPGDEAQAVQLQLRLCVYEPGSIDRLARQTAAGGQKARLHLKVDTGMARLGCSPDEAVILARRIQQAPGLELEGLWTHFAEADDAASPRTREQLHRFLSVVGDLAAAGAGPTVLHAANSGAALHFPDTHLTLVRCGLPIYGYSPLAEGRAGTAAGLRPVLTWKARVVALHELGEGDRVGYGGTFSAARRMTSATVSTGYADGYPRALSGAGEVIVRGRRAGLVGRVSMDFITFDASDIPGVALGDEVVLIGEQGGEQVSADDLARATGTISWEILARIGPRVDRVPVPARATVRAEQSIAG